METAFAGLSTVIERWGVTWSRQRAADSLQLIASMIARTGRIRRTGSIWFPEDPRMVAEAEPRRCHPCRARPCWCDRRCIRFKDSENDGASALELEGDVIVRNRPDMLEENDLDAGFLRLDFARRASTPVVDSEGLPLRAHVREAFLEFSIRRLDRRQGPEWAPAQGGLPCG